MERVGIERTNYDLVQRTLDKGNINIRKADEVLQISEYGLLRLGSLTPTIIDRMTRDAASSLLQPGFRTTLEVEKYDCFREKLSTGCDILNKVLGGGFSTRGITEISGESGCGKTQLCLQLCLSVQYPKSSGGFGAGAVYICTEDSFPSRRLNQLFQTYTARRNDKSLKLHKLPRFGDNIYVEHIADPEGMRQCIFGRLPKLLSQVPIRLIVVDSIAGVYRSCYENNEMKDRAQEMRRVGGQLHLIASQYNASVICINQVGAVISEKNPSSFQSNRCAPALGLAWANIVTTRIQMHRFEPSGADSSTNRYLEVVFSPNLPPFGTHYSILAGGVFGISSI